MVEDEDDALEVEDEEQFLVEGRKRWREVLMAGFKAASFYKQRECASVGVGDGNIVGRGLSLVKGPTREVVGENKEKGSSSDYC